VIVIARRRRLLALVVPLSSLDASTTYLVVHPHLVGAVSTSEARIEH